MQTDKKYLLIGSLLALVWIGLPRFFYLLFSSIYTKIIIWVFILCLGLIGLICILAAALYFFISEYQKNKSVFDGIRKSFYNIRVVLYIYLSCLIFDSIFYFLSILFVYPPTTFQISVILVLSFVTALILVPALQILFNLNLQKKEKLIQDEHKKIDEEIDRVLEEAKKDFQN